MRSKTILSTAAFIVAFGFSTVLASLFITETQTAPIYPSFNETKIETVPGYYSDKDHKSTSCFKYKNNSSPANKISGLIRQDNLNGSENDQALFGDGEDIFSPSAISEFSRYAAAVEQYVDASSSMKTGELPIDFQTEWREHLKAWREYSEFLNRMKSVSSRKSLTTEELREVGNFHNREINRTYEVVLQTAEKYGANVR